MSRQEESKGSATGLDPRADTEDVSRTEEEGEADEPDAPTAAEENEGMSTILGTDPLTGVQTDASEE